MSEDSTRKALELACKHISEISGDCPSGYFDADPWLDEHGRGEGCAELCFYYTDDPSICWAQYFITKART